MFELVHLCMYIHRCQTVETGATVSNERLFEMIQTLTYLDIRLVHLYSEGMEMTIADLCLFSYLYFLLVSC